MKNEVVITKKQRFQIFTTNMLFEIKWVKNGACVRFLDKPVFTGGNIEEILGFGKIGYIALFIHFRI